ncbi:hypothetical protein B0T17DRAFT_504262 [Bombardia bombarda]|uniref:Uncharacterized protein n=1 Tax=Bombardia bombarda TaxID=252184 RepID=A0AA40CFG4_9PEZI|nr:hypothetical protein B0T17DRAFT_504262 [Bombardia bombarda]
MHARVSPDRAAPTRRGNKPSILVHVERPPGGYTRRASSTHHKKNVTMVPSSNNFLPAMVFGHGRYWQLKVARATRQEQQAVLNSLRSRSGCLPRRSQAGKNGRVGKGPPEPKERSQRSATAEEGGCTSVPGQSGQNGIQQQGIFRSPGWHGGKLGVGHPGASLAQSATTLLRAIVVIASIARLHFGPFKEPPDETHWFQRAGAASWRFQRCTQRANTALFQLSCAIHPAKADRGGEAARRCRLLGVWTLISGRANELGIHRQCHHHILLSHLHSSVHSKRLMAGFSFCRLKVGTWLGHASGTPR